MHKVARVAVRKVERISTTLVEMGPTVEMQPILRAGDRYATFLDVMGRPGRTGFGPEDCSCEVPPRTRAPSRGFEENG